MSKSETAQALDNLSTIKEGGDPRMNTATNNIDIIPRVDLKFRHDSIVRDGDKIYEDFVEVVNTIEPEHPYQDNPYPATMDDFEFSYCRSSSNIWARCGPRHDKVATFSRDKKAMGKMTKGRYYAVLVHEATHITEGRHSPGSIHNPTFWNQFADNCVKLIENDYRGNTTEFISHARNDPNSKMTDRRSNTVSEQRQAVEDRILRQI